jgi:hypothetical protein
VLFTDTTPGLPLAYVQQIDGRRRDVLIAGSGPMSDEARQELDRRVNLFAAGAPDAPGVFVVSKEPGYLPQWTLRDRQFVPFDLIWKVEPAGKEAAP